MIIIRLIKFIIKAFWKSLMFIRDILSLLFLVMFFGMIAVVIGVVINLSKTEYPPQTGILLVNIQGSVVDNPAYSEEVYNLLVSFDPKNRFKRENSLFVLADKIHHAADNPDIKALVLQLDDLQSIDLPALSYLAKELNYFKSQNKKILAIGAQYSAKNYYLASLADEIYLQPVGAVNLYGFSANSLFFKKLLDKLKVNVHIFKVGTYKSAIEPFIRDDMSPEAKENLSRWIHLMWTQFINDIADNRKQPLNLLTPSSDEFIERLKQVNGSMTDYALAQHLVDQIISRSAFNYFIQQQYYGEPLLSIYDYQLPEQTVSNNQIYVIPVEGSINTGLSTKTTAGSDTVVAQINQAIDAKTKGIILRVNSPGGSVVASEEIRQQLKFARQKGIPVVVSMGGMAASGGYWISTESDYIVADKNTLTGSIGIFAIVPTFEESLSEIGIHSESTSTSTLAEQSNFIPLSPELSEIYQLSVNNGYQLFLSLVSKARNLTIEETDKIAQGQVWLGSEALEIKLVDELGDFDTALNQIARLALIDDYQIVWPNQKKMPAFDEMVMGVSSYLPQSITTLIYEKLPFVKLMEQQLEVLGNLDDPTYQYLYCTTCANVD